MIQVHPFVREHPNAVFVMRSELRDLRDAAAAAQAGRRAAQLVFRRASAPTDKRRIVIKPNITTAPELDPQTQAPMPNQEGVVVNPQFAGGFIDGIRAIDDAPIAVAEGTGEDAFVLRGYRAAMQSRGVELLTLNQPQFTEKDDPREGLNWSPVNGTVFRNLPFVRPIGDPDVFFISMPKMKAHNLAVTTLAIKNTQGTIALNYFRQHCTGLQYMASAPEHVRRHYQPDAVSRVEALLKQHLAAGYRQWHSSGIRDELYAQKAIDSLAGPRPEIYVLEGCTMRDGSGFRHGTDLLANYVIAGLNPLSVDTVGTWVMGHDPRQIGLYRVANERGIGENDPDRIEVFDAAETGFRPIACRSLPRLAVGVRHYSAPDRLVFYQ